MKKAASVLLIVLSLLIGFQRVIIVMHYELNWERIEQRYCENKNSLIMTCKGICYVQKAFQKSEEKGSTSSKIVYQKAELFFETLVLLYSLVVDGQLLNQACSYVDIRYVNPIIEVLVPPPLYVTDFI